MAEKVKSVSLGLKEDKYKSEEKLSKLEDQKVVQPGVGSGNLGGDHCFL
jgi:hypothetical protein